MKTLLLLLGLMLCFASYSQIVIPGEVILVSADSTLHLYVENKKSHKRVEIKVGDALSYKKIGSFDYVKGLVTKLTATGISFENKRKERVSMLYTDLESLVIPRSPGRRLGGVVLIVAGVAGIIGGISSKNNNGMGGSSTNSSARGLGIGGTVALMGGLFLIQPKRIDLQKSKVIKTITRQ